MKVMITGHRSQKLEKYLTEDELKPILVDKLFRLPRPVTYMVSGMAIGVDIVWAEIAIEKDIPLIAAVPFVGQSSRWSIEQQKRYDKVLNNKLTSVKIVSPGSYAPAKLLLRNEWMVDYSDFLLGVCDYSKSGTSSCINYAKKKRLNGSIFNLKTLKWEAL